MTRYAVVNASSLVTDADVYTMWVGVKDQLWYHVSVAWNRKFIDSVFVAKGGVIPSDCYPIYVLDNPDVADAVKKGDVEDARLHYIGFGYFEGRLGGTPAVDERWYLNTYTDVAQGVRVGRIGSASEHYDVIGASEGRSPSADYLPIAEHWKKALVGA